MDTNLKLYLPFDDPTGSVAADFTTNRNDADLSDGAALTDENSKIGKALALNGGTAETDYDIPFSSAFTLCCYICPQTSRLGWILNFSGLENYLEQWYDVQPGTWYFLALVRTSTLFLAYLNKELMFRQEISATPVGLSVSEPGLFNSQAYLDEVKVYNRALTAAEVLAAQAQQDVEYYINSVNFKDYGVYVSQSSGLVGQLEKKEGLTVAWDTYHGKVRDKKNPRYKERKITLDCFIQANSRAEFVNKVNDFFAQFDGSGTQRLKVEYDGTAKPLVYEVFQSKSVDPTKTWGHYNRELMAGTFKLELEEDEPVKRVLRFPCASNGTVSVKFKSTKLLNIYWGDNSHTYNLSGDHTGDSAVTHTFTAAGEYDIVITGVIEDVTDFTTNAIVIWNKLK